MSEGITHFGPIRLRVVGNGNLRMTLYSLNDVKSQLMTNLVLSATNDVEPTKLANFITQRASLKVETTAINEWFQIHKIIIFTKLVASSYPQ